jgi:hypothetical protein
MLPYSPAAAAAEKLHHPKQMKQVWPSRNTSLKVQFNVMCPLLSIRTSVKNNKRMQRGSPKNPQQKRQADIQQITRKDNINP